MQKTCTNHKTYEIVYVFSLHSFIRALDIRSEFDTFMYKVMDVKLVIMTPFYKKDNETL